MFMDSIFSLPSTALANKASQLGISKRKSGSNHRDLKSSALEVREKLSPCLEKVINFGCVGLE